MGQPYNPLDGSEIVFVLQDASLVPVPVSALKSSSTILQRSGSASSVTGTTGQTTLATIPVPALGMNSVLRITTAWTFPNSGNSKTLGIQLGGQTLRNFIQAGSGAAQENWNDMVFNRGATNSQLAVLAISSGGNVSDQNALAVDTSVPTSMTITGQLALGTETLTLQAYCVELFL